MKDLRALYDEVVLDHGRRPRNYGRLARATHAARGENPLCGDRIDVALVLDGDTVEEVRFEGEGCAISMASASLMTEALRGRTRDEARTLFRRVQEICGPRPEEGLAAVDVGALAALAGVRHYPVRVQCALLAWKTMQRALEHRSAERV